MLTALFFLDTDSTDVGLLPSLLQMDTLGRYSSSPQLKNKQTKNSKIRTGYRGRKGNLQVAEMKREPIGPEPTWAMEEAGLDVCLRIGVSVMPGNES